MERLVILLHSWMDIILSNSLQPCSCVRHDSSNPHQVHKSSGEQKPTPSALQKEDTLCEGLMALCHYIMGDTDLQEKDVLDLSGEAAVPAEFWTQETQKSLSHKKANPSQTAVPGLAAALSTCRVASGSVVDLEVTVSKTKLLTTVQVSPKLVGSGATVSQGAADLWKTAMSGSVWVFVAVQSFA